MNINWITHKSFSYFIISAFRHESDIESNLKINSSLEDSIYLLDYSIIKIGAEVNGYKSDALFCYNLNRTSDDIRKDLLYLLAKYNLPSGVVKYFEENLPKKVLKNGEEVQLNIVEWSADNNIINYFYNGIRFSFKEMKRYSMIKNLSDIKKGMTVEYLNNDIWVSRVVENVNEEWDRMYKLLVKYNKLRC